MNRDDGEPPFEYAVRDRHRTLVRGWAPAQEVYDAAVQWVAAEIRATELNARDDVTPEEWADADDETREKERALCRLLSLPE